tara:strand:+ start:682 stop:1065 length:384 start_codon:yes stop_codon:yes gene_type:complete
MWEEINKAEHATQCQAGVKPAIFMERAMAIQKEITSRHGVNAPQAYHWVETVYTDREKKTNNTTVRVKIYSSQQAKADGLHPLERVEFVFTLDTTDKAENSVKQGYIALKTKDNVGGYDFTSGTTDV